MERVRGGMERRGMERVKRKGKRGEMRRRGESEKYLQS